MTVKVQRSDCANTGAALTREWLETNGIGGYASSSILGCNTRKYHGLLVPRLQAPAGKFVLLSKYEESLQGGDEELYFSRSQYGDVVHPEGAAFLIGFEMEKTPLFKYQTPKVNLTKRVAMLQGKNATVTSYESTKNSGNSRLLVRPLFAYRDFHSLSKENVSLQVRTFPAKSGFKFEPYQGMPPIFVQVVGDFEFFPSPAWYRNFTYQEEIARGFEHAEDLFCPGMFEFKFKKGTTVLVSASTEEFSDVESEWRNEMADRSAYFKGLRGTSLQKPLKWAARQFVSTRPSGHKAITAGFPWFLEWGRDAMIALPGLLLNSKMDNDYISVLREFSANMNNGVVPNFLGNTKEDNAYNSADASLWFVWAVQQYLETTGDYSSLKGDLICAIDEIFTNYREGTINSIRMLDNGLIAAGSHHTQITWMDANSGGGPVTPRDGCPVEINALWYNMLLFMGELSKRGDLRNGKAAQSVAPKTKAAFVKSYWLEQEGYLADLVDGDRVDTAVRPNQIFAASLPFSPLSDTQKRSVVERVTRDLYTPLGLRTLSPDHPSYKAAYEGGPERRDAAYHNGTVWPWLIGHYVEAFLKTAQDKTAATRKVEEILDAFKGHLLRDGVGTISEIFDGEKPYRGHGCPSQAWSVAEVLRVTRMLEELKKGRNRKTMEKKR